MPPLSDALTCGPIISESTSDALVRLFYCIPALEDEEETPSCQNGQKVARKVRFDESLDVTEPTLLLEEYSSEEIVATWYDEDEVKELRIRIRAMVEKIENGLPLDAEDCIRGLEMRTREEQKKRYYEVNAAVYAVLDEQESQDFSGTQDQEEIARIYSMYTKESQEAARERGVTDETDSNMLLKPETAQ